MSDIHHLLAAEQTIHDDHHWGVAYSVRLHDSVLAMLKSDEPCQDCGQVHDEDDLAVVSDTVTVAGGDNAETAIARVRAHVLDETKYGIKVNPDSFRLKGVKLLSIREI